MGEVDNFKKKVEEGEVATITLLLDNDTEMECDISAIFQVKKGLHCADPYL